MTKWHVFWLQHDYENDVDFEHKSSCLQNGYNLISEFHISQILASKYKKYLMGLTISQYQ